MKFRMLTCAIMLSITAQAMASGNPQDNDEGNSDAKNVRPIPAVQPATQRPTRIDLDDWTFFEDLEKLDPDLELAIQLSQQQDLDTDSDMLEAIKLSMQLNSQPKNAIDLLPSIELNEVDKAVSTCEDLLTYIKMDSAEQTKIGEARKFLRINMDALIETAFVKCALAGGLPTNESDINFKARLTLCYRLREIFEPQKPMDTETLLLPMSALSSLPTFKPLFVDNHRPHKITNDYFTKDAAFLKELLRGFGMIVGLNGDEVKNLFLPADCLRRDLDSQLRRLQMRYTAFRDDANLTEKDKEETPGFIECQDLIRQLNTKLPGFFPATDVQQSAIRG